MAFEIAKKTVVPLRLLQQLSTRDARGGEALPFEALRDVTAGGWLVVRKGAPASGMVESVAKSWKGLQGGQVRIALKQVELADGEALPLNSVFRTFGGGIDRTSTGSEVLTSAALMSPETAAMGLLIGGQDVIFPKGTRMDGYVVNLMPLDSAKLPPATTAPADSRKPVTAQPEKEMLQVRTVAGDGSLYVDGEYQAEAPATLTLERGVHLLTVRRDGYKVWRQRVLVDGDELDLMVPLVKK